MNDIEIGNILKSKGLSNTAQRRQVFKLLLTSDPITIAEIAKYLESTCDRATVYRIIEQFESGHIIHKIHRGFKVLFEISDEYSDHHHHAYCNDCGANIDLAENPELELVIQNIIDKLEFTNVCHTLEITGRCKNCQLKINTPN